MNEERERYVAEFIALLNVLFILYLIMSCLQIININYFSIGYTIIISFGLYYFYFYMLKSTVYRLAFIVALFLLVVAAVYFTKGRIIGVIISKLVDNYYFIDTCILNDMVISYSHIDIYFKFLIPITLYLFIGIDRKFIMGSTLVSSVLIVFSWYLIFYQQVVRCIPAYIGIVFVTLGARAYIKKVKEYKRRELKLSLNMDIIVKSVLIIAFILPLAVKIMPQEYEGVTLESVNSFFTNAFAGKKDDEKGKIYKESYNISQSGYHDSDTELGGSVSINNAEAFTVEADRPYYLRGRVKYEYTGKGWKDYGKDVLGKMEDKVKEHSSKFKDNDGAFGYNIEDTKTIKITPSSKLSTNTFFTPNCATDIIYGYSSIYADNVPLFVSDTSINHPYEIKINSYGHELDDCMQDISAFALDKSEYIDIYNRAVMYPRIIRQYGEAEDDFISAIKASINMRLDLIGEESDYIGDYLHVPGTVDERVYKLTETVLKDEADRQNVNVEELSNIDRAIAIKNYLVDNYEYRTIVEGQKDDDFVSDFLLNSRKGYCTYFASAAVIMCRIAGVPARYVEGFTMSGADKGKNVYQIRNTNAHAWCEVLIGVNEDKWSVVDAVPSAETYDPNTTVIQQTDEPGYDREYINSRENMMNQSSPVIMDDVPYDERGGNWSWLWITAAVLLSVIISLMLVYIIRRQYILRNKSIVPYYNYICRRIYTVGISKEKSQGEYEFASSIADENLRREVLMAAEAFYGECYGDNYEISFDRKDTLNNIEKIIRKKDNLIGYIIKKYVIGFRSGGKRVV